MERQRSQNNQNILKKKNRVRGLILLDFKTQSNAKQSRKCDSGENLDTY